MKCVLTALTAIVVAPSTALAACPPPPDISEPSARLILELREAESEGAARELNGELWKLWLMAPDAASQALLDDGIARLRVADHLGAEEAFSRLIDYCPAYAEGYNQRAFSFYLRGDYPRALADLDEALELRPTHIGALSGKALTLMGLGEVEAGQQALRDALALNPWLSERSLLIETPGEKL